MAPQATSQGESQPTLTKHELPANKATYIVGKPEMEELLEKTFGAGLQFHVSTKNGRWIYYAERELTSLEVRWIAELDKRKKAQKAEEEARARAGGSDSSDESGGE